MCRPDAAFILLVCELPSRAWEGGKREEQEAGWVRPYRGDAHTPEHVTYEVGNLGEKRHTLIWPKLVRMSTTL